MTRSTTTVAPPQDAAPADQPGWVSCPGCGWLLYRKRLDRNLSVCPECDHHLRLGARARIDLLVDPDSFSETTFAPGPRDPLSFTDLRDYPDRLREAAQRSGETEAVVVGTGRIGGTDAVVAVMDFGFLGGSMGVEVGRRVSGAAALALELQRPLVTVCASGGARMQEGVFSLFQMARASEAFARLREAGLLSVCVLTDPTYGGVSASFATLGAVLVAERGAHVGFAGRRVIQETIRSELPEDFQTAEFLLAHGLVDRVENRAELRPLLGRLLALHGRRPDVAAPAAGARPEPPTRLDAWDVVQTARETERPTTLDYLRTAFDDFVELHGDRAFADDPAVVGGLASIGGRSVVVIGHEKGHTVRERVARNFGMPHPEGYRKALRLMKLAEKFGLPVFTFVDTPGAYPGIGAEERGQAEAIAVSLEVMSRLRTPVISTVIGEGGSGGALAIGVGNRVLMMENSIYSVISPEGCASILFRDPTKAEKAADAMKVTAKDLLQMNVVDEVVQEPPGGAHRDPARAAEALGRSLRKHLTALKAMTPDQLVADRYRKFREMGMFSGGGK
jgi:acyl-CoA carboxylase subunit beta